MITIGVRLSKELHDRLKRATGLRHTSISEVVRQAILDYCEEIEQKYDSENNKSKKMN